MILSLFILDICIFSVKTFETLSLSLLSVVCTSGRFDEYYFKSICCIQALTTATVF